MNEADTRAEFVDPQLLAAGWKTDSAKGVRVRREYHINDGEIRASDIRTRQLITDYVLEYIAYAKKTVTRELRVETN